MLGTPEERLCKRLRERQYVGFTETNATLNEAAQVIERIAAERDAALAEVARMKEGAGWRAMMLEAEAELSRRHDEALREERKLVDGGGYGWALSWAEGLRIGYRNSRDWLRDAIKTAPPSPSRAWTDAEVEAAARAFVDNLGLHEAPDWPVHQITNAMRAALSTLNTSLQNMQTTQAVSVPSREYPTAEEMRLAYIERRHEGPKGEGATKADAAAWEAVRALFTAPQRE